MSIAQAERAPVHAADQGTVPTAEKLAIHGGPKAVTTPPEEKWVKVNDDAKRAVIELMEQGVNSLGGSSGIIGEFEQAFAAMVGTEYALTMTNGTSALH